MNHYIFLTTTIRNVGGAQLYIARKQEWLESIGWNVSVFYYNRGNVVIEALKKHSNNFIDELSENVYALSSKQVFAVVSKIIPENCEKMIIESHLVNLCLWGEVIANYANGMNLCYLLCEDFPKLRKYERDYLLSRLDHNLLFGITNNSIPMLLGEFGKTKNRGLLAVGCSANNVDNIAYDLTSLTNSQTILCIGRLDKPYVPSIIFELCEFAASHANNDYNVILLGDSADRTIANTFVEQLSVYKNINVICTGYLFPIPRCIFTKSDVAIASSGSVTVSSNEGIPTIAIDANDFQAIGIFKHTTNHSIYRDFEPQQRVCDLLEDVLVYKKYPKKIVSNSLHTVLDYSNHLQIINSYQEGLVYKKIKKRPLIAYPFFIMVQIFGISRVKRIKKIIVQSLTKLKKHNV